MSASPPYDEAARRGRQTWLEEHVARLDDASFERLVRAFAQAETEAATEVRPRHAVTIADVLAEWRREGPLVHEPTGIEALDGLTGGGPVYGSRWYLVGAPDAGKTALLVQLAELFARRGVVVGVLAVDEEAGDLVTRLAQRAGWKRRDCEERDAQVVDAMGEALSGLPLKLYDVEWTIEAAADDVAGTAKELGARAALFIDSIQSVRSSAAATAESLREIVTANVSAVRAAATRHRLIAIATSEMNRGAYRSIDAAERSNDMAAAKESSAIEYSARVMLALRSVKNEPETVELKITKNKHGPGDRELYLKLDRRHMSLAECEMPRSCDAAAARRDKAAEGDRRVQEVIEALRVALLRAKCAPTSRKDLAGLVRGERRVIEAGITELLRDGLIRGGRGRPYVWFEPDAPVQSQVNAKDAGGESEGEVPHAASDFFAADDGRAGPQRP